MLVEKVKHSGALVISRVIDGILITRRYYGCTKREALQAFNDETKSFKKEKQP